MKCHWAAGESALENLPPPPPIPWEGGQDKSPSEHPSLSVEAKASPNLSATARERKSISGRNVQELWLMSGFFLSEDIS